MGPGADLYGRVTRDRTQGLRAFLDRYVPGWLDPDTWCADYGIAPADLVEAWGSAATTTTVLYAAGPGTALDVTHAMVTISPWDGRVLGISCEAASGDDPLDYDGPADVEERLTERVSVTGADSGFWTLEEPPPAREEEWVAAVAAWLQRRPKWQEHWSARAYQEPDS